jgi:hypothetical protein
VSLSSYKEEALPRVLCAVCNLPVQRATCTYLEYEGVQRIVSHCHGATETFDIPVSYSGPLPQLPTLIAFLAAAHALKRIGEDRDY